MRARTDTGCAEYLQSADSVDALVRGGALRARQTGTASTPARKSPARAGIVGKQRVDHLLAGRPSAKRDASPAPKPAPLAANGHGARPAAGGGNGAAAPEVGEGHHVARSPSLWLPDPDVSGSCGWKEDDLPELISLVLSKATFTDDVEHSRAQELLHKLVSAKAVLQQRLKRSRVAMEKQHKDLAVYQLAQRSRSEAASEAASVEGGRGEELAAAQERDAMSSQLNTAALKLKRAEMKASKALGDLEEYKQALHSTTASNAVLREELAHLRATSADELAQLRLLLNDKDMLLEEQQALAQLRDSLTFESA